MASRIILGFLVFLHLISKVTWFVAAPLASSGLRLKLCFILNLRRSLCSTVFNCSPRRKEICLSKTFMKMRGIADQVAAIGKPLDDDELNMHLMAGFGPEYEALVVNTMHRKDDPDLQEIQLVFQAYEVRLAQQHTALLEHSAQLAYHGRGAGYPVNFGCGSSPTSGVATGGFGRGGRTNAGRSEDAGNLVESEGGNCYVDSGATTHITHDLNKLAISSDYSGNENLIVGNGNMILISSIGYNSPLVPSASSSSLLLNNILFVPQITKNLLSISQFTEDNNNVVIEFNSNSCYVKDKISHKILLKGCLSKGLYKLDLAQFLGKSQTFSTSSPGGYVYSSATSVPKCVNSFPNCNVAHLNSVSNSTDVVDSKLVKSTRIPSLSSVIPKSCMLTETDSQHFVGMCVSDVNTLHQIFGHPNNAVISHLCASLKIPFSAKNLHFCEACNLGKMHQKSHVFVPTKTTKPFELVHSDL